MEIEELTSILDNSWTKGFFYSLRNGVVDKSDFAILLNGLSRFSATHYTSFPKEFVSLIWFIPTFIDWQEERLLDNGVEKEEFKMIYDSMCNECERILGLP
ncbi:hypothetical protein GC194_04215 [bacterium]|nr:hypothetical protein [bacterium]